MLWTILQQIRTHEKIEIHQTLPPKKWTSPHSRILIPNAEERKFLLYNILLFPSEAGSIICLNTPLNSGAYTMSVNWVNIMQIYEVIKWNFWRTNEN